MIRAYVSVKNLWIVVRSFILFCCLSFVPQFFIILACYIYILAQPYSSPLFLFIILDKGKDKEEARTSRA